MDNEKTARHLASDLQNEEGLEKESDQTPRRSSIVRTPSPEFRSSRRLSSNRAIVASPIEAKDDRISILDPRRFTPTLHASLVAEILSLRRDNESKNDFIYNLETTLQQSKIENDTMSGNLAHNAQEKRSLLRQLQLLEGGTSSAMETLVKERDEANDSITEIKKRLDTYQKKIKHQEEDANRTQKLWEKDKDRWDAQRRLLEQRVHIAEGRLKAVVEEIDSQQLHDQSPYLGDEHDADGHSTKMNRAIDQARNRESIRSLESANERPTSSASSKLGDKVYTNRFSLATALYANEGSQLSGLSLADELNFSGDEEEATGDLMPSPTKSLRDSRQWYTQDESAMRALALSKEPMSPTRPAFDTGHDAPPTPPAEGERSRGSHTNYRDASVQVSPPPSPPLPASESFGVQVSDGDGPIHNHLDGISGQETANDSAKYAPASMASVASQTTESSQVAMTSSQTQTIQWEELLLERIEDAKSQVESVAIQTEETETLAKTDQQKPPPTPISIPSIAVHPPLSSPTSPKESILPPQYKSFGCQAENAPISSSYTSSYAQTDIIRVLDGRIKLPPHLLPSAISSIPPTPRSEERNSRSSFTPVPGHAPADTVKKSLKHLSSSTLTSSPPPLPRYRHDIYPGNNDSGPLDNDNLHGPKLPFRSSSLFAGFDPPSSDEVFDFSDIESSDDEFATALSPPMHYSRANRPSLNVLKKGTGSHNEKGSPDTLPSFIKADISAVHRGPLDEKSHNSGATDSLQNSGLTARPKIPRRSRIASSRMFLRSPKDARAEGSTRSGDNVGLQSAKEHAPPIPVPVRSSSRKTSSLSDRSSPTPRHDHHFLASLQNNDGETTGLTRNNLRKMRLVAAIQETEQEKQPFGLSAPAFSSPSAASDSLDLPPLPNDEVTYPGKASKGTHRPLHRRQPSNHTLTTAQSSVPSSNQQTGVVDAIAQTMVGEWMWKYVRRRKSFGVADTSSAGADGRGGDAHNGVRHKRWVWLAPYERSVMWSSKQPVSGAALMGKSGRKLVIQSVLDVKDDSPAPKDAGTDHLFNRSILILTPARALKFTAVSKERHYVWLTALSFLSHASQTGNEIARIPPPPIPKQEIPVPQKPPAATLRRNPIRDSIRIAKSKARPALPAAARNRAPHPMPIQESEAETTTAVNEPSLDAASPPAVPRVSKHGRKRSTTGPRLPPPPSAPFRSFSYNPSITSAQSIRTTTSSSEVQRAPSFATSGPSLYGEKVSEGGDVAGRNFFEAIGTVRMEAFVESTTGEPPRGGGTQDDMVSASFRRGHLRRTREGLGYADFQLPDLHRDSGLPDPFQEF
ncbi:hypothetical protein L228DRAFT_249236 [Xylona heveae TC161]|uniref:Pleckstrin homology domain-containing protein n=1 Tax=Xylona heveae (strain CBS 132557 / TC161) TaxID=1328760 RepID=A0A165FVA1_XYLHT|nr:hypothetical protein L228DRAFT_249236 [Xylona heveae TC161]KZF21422.1 hypothetical protein L228DRAFT_249236 [Xylona heveae TC161]